MLYLQTVINNTMNKENQTTFKFFIKLIYSINVVAEAFSLVFGDLYSEGIVGLANCCCGNSLLSVDSV